MTGIRRPRSLERSASIWRLSANQYKEISAEITGPKWIGLIFSNERKILKYNFHFKEFITINQGEKIVSSKMRAKDENL